MSKSEVNEMSFLDHLEELRWHLIRSTLAIVLGGFIIFLNKAYVFGKLIQGPKDPNFITYRLLCSISKSIGLDDSFCINEMSFTIITTGMSDKFSIHVWTSITLGVIIAFPYILWELWKFIKPGLHDNEKKHSKLFIFSGSLLFFLGVLFGYYIIAPLSVNFLGGYTLIPGNDIMANPTISSYIGVLRSVVLASGLMFELPIIIYFLTKIGLVTPEFLKKYRKHALVVILILSAVITPPDITSQIIVAIPVLILYQVSIYISRYVIKKEQRRAA
ncbi:twin-arginine translocase subunit TatC [Sinomicrobium oceani]|uniref:twin-arginine translocase subunit TatC n=1 Tax=Sinomicrobium oceani TaxID=1150368 RepID=UPI00227B3F93|nr:twin-arginine translocase subunit TatC [Sinomicrobium oceani]